MNRFIKVLIYLVLIVIANELYKHPFKFIEDSKYSYQKLAQSIEKKDQPFEPQETYLEGLLFEIRNSPNLKYYIPIWDLWELYLYDRALPKLLVKPENVKNEKDTVSYFYGYGPQKEKPNLDESNSFITRWLGMLLVLVCTVGVTFYFKDLIFPLRVLLGFLILGWGTLVISLVTNIPYSRLYTFIIPISFVGFLIFCIRSFSKHKIIQFLHDYKYLFLILIFLPAVWTPFLTDVLNGPDARTMWFYRYKFAFLYGFNPQLITDFMAPSSQRDYSWLFAGPFGIASVLPNKSFAGWYENAVFGSLLWLLIAVLMLVWKKVSNRNIVEKVLFILTFVYPFREYFLNGYFDFYWIILMSIFLLCKSFSILELFILLCSAVSIKYEAFAMMLVFLGIELISYIKNKQNIRSFLKDNKIVFLSLIPILFQKYILQAYGVIDQYQIGKQIVSMPIYDAIKRFESAHRFLIINVFFERLKYILPFILLYFSKDKLVSILKAIGFAYVLLFPAMIIYTYTPNDQDWQLITSAYRVFLFYPCFAIIKYLIDDNKHLIR